MNKKLLSLLVFLLVTIFCKAQLKIDCNNKIGINTEPISNRSVNMKGDTRINFSSGRSIVFQYDSNHGWDLSPDIDDKGKFGYYSHFYSLTAKYIYADNVVYTSDRNLKKNISNLNNALPIIKKLRPVSFDYNYNYSHITNTKTRNKLHNDDKNRLGFIAQEVQQILPQTVQILEPDTLLGIRMIDFVPLLVKGMQEQTIYIDSLINEISKLKKTQNLLKSEKIQSSYINHSKNATLSQSEISPYTKQVSIQCFIPENCSDAHLRITDMQGNVLKSNLISERNNTSVRIAGSEFQPGIYNYTLIVDNYLVDSKHMILSN